MAAFGILVVFAVVAGAGWLWLRSRRAEEPVLPAVGASVAPGEGEPFVLVNIQDITSLKRAEIELKKAFATLERQNTELMKLGIP